MSDHAAAARQRMWDERHAARQPIESAEPDPTLAGLAAGLAPGRALDLAAGDGRNAVWLAARGWDVTAVDFSVVALARARALADAAAVTIDVVQADLLDWRPGPGSFDLVIVMFLHLPVEERRAVYGRAAAAVGPGGRLLVVGHDRGNLGRGVGGPQDPAILFTPPEIAEDLLGLVVERAETVVRDIGAGRQALDAVVVGRRTAKDAAHA